MIHLPVLVTDHVSAEQVKSAIFARGLRKIYESYPATTGESSGVFLWLRQLRQAMRLTAAAPRTVVALDGIIGSPRRSPKPTAMATRSTVTRSCPCPS